jgi:hypothetical protein
MALQTNSEAYLPVILSLGKLHARSLWHTLKGGKNGLDLWSFEEQPGRYSHSSQLMDHRAFFFQLIQVIGLAKIASLMQENNQRAVRLLVVKIKLLPMIWMMMDLGTWGRRRKNTSANGAKIPKSPGKMKIQSKSVPSFSPFYPVLTTSMY